MLNQATMDMLTAMKMTAMPAEFANQLKDPTFNELGFEERLGLLVNAEWNRRQSNKLNRFIRNARFAVPSSTVEGINTTRTESWTRHRCCGLPPASTLTKATTLSSREPLATARLTSPVPWAMPPAAVSRRCSTSVCQSCWTN